MENKSFKEFPAFVKEASFCVTVPGSKQPFDPFRNKWVGATDRFYSWHKIKPLLIEHEDWTPGIKVGTGGISAIDIDHCVDDQGLSRMALEIVELLNVYTEYSPSGTGIRLLFKTDTPFDIDKYFVKNTLRGIEYYDAAHCINSGARMVRLTGNMINLGNEEVDTSLFLEKYMTRPVITRSALADDKEPNAKRIQVLNYLITILPEFYEFNTRAINHLSESEWDIMFLNAIARYSDVKAEIEEVFYNSPYFKSKDNFHLRKWNNERYVTGTWDRVSNEGLPNTIKTWLSVYDEDIMEDLEGNLDMKILTTVLTEIGIIKSNYRPEIDKYTAASALYYSAYHNITARSWSRISKSFINSVKNDIINNKG